MKSTLNSKMHHKDRLRTGWLTPKELPFFLKFITLLFKFSDDFKLDSKNLSRRILYLVSKSGWNFTFQYMKEVSRILIRVIMTREVSPSLGKPFVRMDKTGYPSIIPLRWRGFIKSLDFSKELRAVDKRQLVGILTILNTFRCFPTKVIADLSTITGPFMGLAKSLDHESIVGGLLDIGMDRPRSLSMRMLGMTASGPNAKVSMWGSLLDMVALIKSPRIWWMCLKLLFHTKNWTFTLIFLFYTLIMSVVYLSTSVIYPWRDLFIGRLSVVFDQAGKARVVAMTNWWIQCLFEPIHRSIFDGLKGIAQVDGTFNQEGCLSEFIRRTPSDKTIYSFDLSAATDRLPLELQKDIMSIWLGNHCISDLWSQIISNISWYYRPSLVHKDGSFFSEDDYNEVKGRYSDFLVKYSVGQPMGALSSWAMLALTHHVIVRIAALKAGLKGFTGYLVLGDDIVIADDVVAENYKLIMLNLGLEINLNKSVIARGSCEFAKKWVINKNDISPVGAKLLLQSFRCPDALFIVLGDLLRRKLTHLMSIPAVLVSLPKRFWGLKSWCFLALISGIYWASSDSRTHFTEYATTVTTGFRRFTNGDRLKKNLIDSYIDDFMELDVRKSRELDNLLGSLTHISYFRRNGNHLHWFSNLINPAFFISLKSLFHYDETAWEDYKWVLSIRDVKDSSWEIISALKNLCLHPNLFSIDFEDKVMVADLRRSTYEMFDGIRPIDLVSELIPYGPTAKDDKAILLRAWKPSKQPISKNLAKRRWLPRVKTR